MFQLEKATKAKAKLRLALEGPAGSGKTYTALTVATSLADGALVGVIDTEHGSASKYADRFDFVTGALTHYDPLNYVKALDACARAGVEVVIVDSLTHAWDGVGGCLDQVDRAGGNSFTAWKKVTPKHNRLVEALLSYPGHVIVTLRSKTAYAIVEEVGRNGRTKAVPKRVGMKPIQRDGLEYEFDVAGAMDEEHRLKINKTRCSELADAVFPEPGDDFAGILKRWLDDGGEAPATPAPALKVAKAPAPEPSIPALERIEAAAVQAMPEGCDLDPNETLCGWLASMNKPTPENVPGRDLGKMADWLERDRAQQMLHQFAVDLHRAQLTSEAETALMGMGVDERQAQERARNTWGVVTGPDEYRERIESYALRMVLEEGKDKAAHDVVRALAEAEGQPWESKVGIDDVRKGLALHLYRQGLTVDDLRERLEVVRKEQAESALDDEPQQGVA